MIGIYSTQRERDGEGEGERERDMTMAAFLDAKSQILDVAF